LPRTKAPFLPPKPSVQEKKPDNADSELQNKLNRRLKRIDSNVTLDEPVKKNMSDTDGPNPELFAKLQWRKSREFN
jgi:ABC-type amino acid transport substrate-binding protein